MKKIKTSLPWILKTILGSAIFALGFNLFLAPHDLSAGGVSGLALIFQHLTKFGTVGTLTILINLPLFILGGVKIGKRFFVGSLIGMISSSVLLDAFALLPVPATEPFLAVLYGGVLTGLGLGLVFIAGTSTGGSDIVVRLLKLRYRDVPIGQISMAFDLVVCALTGLVFKDVTKALYTGVAVFITSHVIDAVVYRFDYSKVVLVITSHYEDVASAVDRQLERGVTFLYGQGSYSRKDTKVVLTVVKKQQLAELKELVVEIDPKAFIIVQEAHQVLGDGFAKYSKDGL